MVWFCGLVGGVWVGISGRKEMGMEKLDRLGKLLVSRNFSAFELCF